MGLLDFRKKKIEKLADKGFDLIHEEDFEGALAVSKQLEELRCTAAFEIGALAHEALGDLPAAIELLQRGVGVAPCVWKNWQLLGNLLSEQEKYGEAWDAYLHALKCENVFVSSVKLNQAILKGRMGQPEETLTLLEKVTDDELRIHAASSKMGALVELDRPDEAISLGQAMLEELDEGDEDDCETAAWISSSIGRAMHRKGESFGGLLDHALEALYRYDYSNRSILAMLRDAEKLYSPDAKYFRLLLDAKIPFTDPEYKESKGYIVEYDVVADDVAEAVRFVERFEDPKVRGNFIVDEQEMIELRPEDPKGVYRRGIRHYYAAEE